MDTVRPGVPVHVGQLGVLDQYRQTAVGEAACQTDNYHDQSETRGGQGTGAVVQSPEVGGI